MFSVFRRARKAPSLRLARGVTTTPLEDGLAVVDERRGTVLHLNTTAQLMLSLLLAGNGPASTAAAVAQRFAVAESAALSDVTGLVNQLTARNLVRWR